MTSLYVAPHLDDVALSCAGGVLARVRARRRVVVCSVFTREDDAGRDRRRVAEDEAALAIAGAERIDLGLRDAPAREGIQPSFEAIVLDARVRPSLVRAVERALAPVLRRLTPREVWLPLGIGGHIDHRTLFAARGVAGVRARFYEDRPYAFVPALRLLRRLELAGGGPRHVAPEVIVRQLVYGGCGALVPPRARLAIAAELTARLATLHIGEGLALRARLIRHPAATLDAAAAVIAAYRSQVRWLFGATPVSDVWARLASARAGWFEREVTVSRRE